MERGDGPAKRSLCPSTAERAGGHHDTERCLMGARSGRHRRGQPCERSSPSPMSSFPLAGPDRHTTGVPSPCSSPPSTLSRVLPIGRYARRSDRAEGVGKSDRAVTSAADAPSRPTAGSSDVQVWARRLSQSNSVMCELLAVAWLIQYKRRGDGLRGSVRPSLAVVLPCQRILATAVSNACLL